MNQPLFGPQQQSPYIRQLLAQQLQQQSKPVHSPVQGVAEMGKQLANAFTARKLTERDEQKSKNRAQALAEAISAPVEGSVPDGQFGPGAPVEPGSREIMARLLKNPDTADFGAHMMLGQVQNRQALDNELSLLRAKMPYELELAREKAKFSPAAMGGSTGVILDRLKAADPNDDIETDIDAIELLKGGAGARGRLGAEIKLGREAEYSKRTGENLSDLEYKPDIAEAVEEAKVRGSGTITDIEKREQDREEAKMLGATSLKSEMDNLENINKVIDKVEDQASAWTTGFVGQMGKFIPGTPQADLAANLQTLLADSALNKLVELKNSSDTGASGLGQVTEREISLLQASRAALMQSQSPEQFRENLKRYKEQRNKTVRRVGEAYKERFGGSSVNLERPSDNDPLGILQ